MRRRRASGRLIDIAIWFLLLVLAAGLVGLVSPVAVWVAAILVPIPLLLSTFRVGVFLRADSDGSPADRRSFAKEEGECS